MEGVKIIPVEPDDKTHLKGPQTSANNCLTGTGDKTVSETVNHLKSEIRKDGGVQDTDNESSQKYVYLYKPDQTDQSVIVNEITPPSKPCTNNNKVEPAANSNKVGGAPLTNSFDSEANDSSASVIVDVEVHRDTPFLKESIKQNIVENDFCLSNSVAGKSVQDAASLDAIILTTECSKASPMSTTEEVSDNTRLVRGDTCDRTSISECKNESYDKSKCDNYDQIKQDVNPNYGGARPKLQIQPRRVQYQKHEMLQGKRDNDGLSELEAYLHERQVNCSSLLKDSDLVISGKMSNADLMHKRRSLPFVPRTSQYEKHSLLQEKTESGHNQIELFLMEKEQTLSAASDKRTHFRKGYSLQGDTLLGSTNAVVLPRPPDQTTQKLVPRGATFERHQLLKKTASGLSELEMLLIDKEREYEKRRRSVDCVGGATASGYSQKLFPRTEQYEKNVLLETLACDGALLLDEVLAESAAMVSQDKESLLDPNSSLKQKRNSGESVRRVHFDPCSVCEESDGEQKDESDRLLDHSSTDSAGSTTSSTARRKKSGACRNKLTTGLTIDRSPETSHSPIGESNIREKHMTKGCCVLS